MKLGQKVMMGICMTAIAALLLVGCGGSPAKTEAPKILKVGTNATFLPFEFKGDDGSYQGFDMDLARALGKQMGMEVEFHNIPFDGLINTINTGEIDMIAAGMTITPARKERVDFIKYYDDGLGIMISDKLVGSVKTLQDLKGKRIAVQIGTTGSAAAHKVEGAEIREFDHNSDAMLELKQGGADAVVSDIPVMKYYLSTTKDTHSTLVEDPISSDELGLAVKKDNKELLEKVSKALEALKVNGEYQKIYDKWFTVK